MTLTKLQRQLRTIIGTDYHESDYVFKVTTKKDETGMLVLTVKVTNLQLSGTVKLWLDYDEAFDKYILQMHYHRGSIKFDNSLRFITMDECLSHPKDLLERAIQEFETIY